MQITRFWSSAGSHAGDRVAVHNGGYRGCCAMVEMSPSVARRPVRPLADAEPRYDGVIAEFPV